MIQNARNKAKQEVGRIKNSNVDEGEGQIKSDFKLFIPRKKINFSQTPKIISIKGDEALERADHIQSVLNGDLDKFSKFPIRSTFSSNEATRACPSKSFLSTVSDGSFRTGHST
jgi:hypothetical protein